MCHEIVADATFWICSGLCDVIFFDEKALFTALLLIHATAVDTYSSTLHRSQGVVTATSIWHLSIVLLDAVNFSTSPALTTGALPCSLYPCGCGRWW